MTKTRLGKIFVTAVVAVSLLATSFALADTSASAATQKRTTVTAQAQKTIGWSKAKSIFKKELPSGATVKYVHLTTDDGRYVYEAEAYKNGYEYEFKFTKGGTLIESEYEKDRV